MGAWPCPAQRPGLTRDTAQPERQAPREEAGAPIPAGSTTWFAGTQSQALASG